MGERASSRAACFKGGLLTRLPRCLTALLLLVVLGTASHARVFTRSVASDDVPAFLEQLGGRTAYRAPVRINGEDARLQVIGFDDPNDARAAEIRAALKLDPSALGADALYTIAGTDRVTRLLLLRPGGGVQTLAVVIEQGADAFRRRRSGGGIAARVLPLPVYPGSTPGLQAENEDTGMIFGTFSAPAAAPEQVTAFYHAALAAAGWQPMFPDADPSGARLYLRRDALCFVLAAPGASGSHISLLHKSLKNPKD